MSGIAMVALSLPTPDDGVGALRAYVSPLVDRLVDLDVDHRICALRYGPD